MWMRDSLCTAGAGLLSGSCTIVADAANGMGLPELKAAVATVVSAGLVFLAQELRERVRERARKAEREEREAAPAAVRRRRKRKKLSKPNPTHATKAETPK